MPALARKTYSISNTGHLNRRNWESGKRLRLARQVAVVTGGGSGIGAATATALAAQGAEVALLDKNIQAANAMAATIGRAALALECDVTDEASVRSAFAAVCESFGGVDIVVSNAGAAWQGRVGDVEDSILRQSFELNFFAHQQVAQTAVAIMKAQSTGGVLLFNTSKQAVNPGAGFRPLRATQDSDARPHASVCAGPWRRRNPCERSKR